MFKVIIRGLNNGEYPIELKGNASEIEFICPEFENSEISISGKLIVHGNKFTIDAKASAQANLVCDLSLESYNENYTIPILLTYIADDDLLALFKANENFDSENIIIRSDEKYIDFTNEVREIFCVNLPMKRIAPKYRDSDINDIFPEINQSDENDDSPIDDRWGKLNNLKLK